ncbi:MAG: DUF1289 domain-containing protein [Gammaproteobacteria bacterium]|jgi:predicted Fe-S protein YdhL (DUF1289 family)
MNSTTGNAPASPCVGICTLDEREICLGCGRTLDEIAAWSRMSATEQQQVIERLPERLAAQEG